MSGGGAKLEATTTATGGSLSGDGTRSNSGKSSRPPFLTGGNATTLGHQTQDVQQRWECLVSNHQNHSLQGCGHFWSMSSRDRRYACKYGGCYTCLAKNSRNCRNGCTRVEEVPAELICVDCAKNTTLGRAPPIILFCGLPGHYKPPLEDVIMSLEAWIPDLNLKGLGVPIQVNFTMFDVYSSSLLTPPSSHKTLTGPPTINPGNVVYDTTTGRSRTVSQKDTINRTSNETAFYAMQTLQIKN